MAGIQNSIIFSQGEKLQVSTTRDIAEMQGISTDVSRINYTGDPNGNISANPSSLCHDPVSGDVYFKQTGTGNTGWIRIPNTATDQITFTPGPGLEVSGSPVSLGGTVTLTPKSPSAGMIYSSGAINVTGDGTVYVVNFDSVYFDINGDFDTSTYTLTVPVAGAYRLTFNVSLYNLDITHTTASVQFSTTGRYIYAAANNPSNSFLTSGTVYNASVLISFNAGDACNIIAEVFGGLKTVGINGGQSPVLYSYFAWEFVSPT